MIRFIAAIDSKQGIADEHGIPWQGKIPGDVRYYHEKIASGGAILMGYGLYKELSKPFANKKNYVASNRDEELKEGFKLVRDARKFQAEAEDDVWNLGGAGLFASTIDQADELYITQLDQDFHCTKFFPDFKDDFRLVSESEPVTENSITYTFQVWRRQDD